MDHEIKNELCSGKYHNTEEALTNIGDNFSRKIYRHFKAAVFSRGRFFINSKIQSLVTELEQEHWIDREAILQKILFIAGARNLEKGYDPVKSSLGTYLTGCALNFLRELKTSLDKGGLIERRLGTWIGEINEFNIVTEGHTPEDLCIAKELYELTYNFFGDLDTRVLFKEINRKEASKEKGKKYGAYSRSFQRKVNEFRQHLLTAGYDDHPLAIVAA